MRIPALLLTLSLVACSSSDDEPEGPGEPVYGEEWTVDWGPVTVASGMEDTRCVVKRVGNDGPIRIGKMVNELGDASHHMVVYRLSEGEEILEPTPCTPFVDVLDPSRGAPLAVTQKESEVIELPPGVAYTLAPDQLVRIEMHYINTGDQDVEVAASTTLVEIPDEDFQYEADFLFIGNPDIEIGPHAEFTLGPSFLPLPDELADIHVFAITGHEHQWGTGVEVALAESEAGPDEMVYSPDPFLWNEPETTYHEPALDIPGGSGFRFTCTYYNDSNDTVDFGESANDEMCFFWAYYYPSHGAKVCAHSDQYNVDLCCPGSSLCSYLEDFLQQ
ncbi:MAG TPA: hypothetical protein VMZ28_21705 [Kofleriaceae bacterium]|nr:hypothetical protein [Kofleriaceae bacterium]